MVEQVKPAGLSRPALPPKDAGEPFINSFMCDTLSSIGIEEYDDCNKIYKVYMDTDSDGKTEIITDINVKFQGKAIEMKVKVDPGADSTIVCLKQCQGWCQVHPPWAVPSLHNSKEEGT